MCEQATDIHVVCGHRIVKDPYYCIKAKAKRCYVVSQIENLMNNKCPACRDPPKPTEKKASPPSTALTPAAPSYKAQSTSTKGFALSDILNPDDGPTSAKTPAQQKPSSLIPTNDHHQNAGSGFNSLDQGYPASGAYESIVKVEKQLHQSEYDEEQRASGVTKSTYNGANKPVSNLPEGAVPWRFEPWQFGSMSGRTENRTHKVSAASNEAKMPREESAPSQSLLPSAIESNRSSANPQSDVSPPKAGYWGYAGHSSCTCGAAQGNSSGGGHRRGRKAKCRCDLNLRFCKSFIPLAYVLGSSPSNPVALPFETLITYHAGFPISPAARGKAPEITPAIDHALKTGEVFIPCDCCPGGICAHR